MNDSKMGRACDVGMGRREVHNGYCGMPEGKKLHARLTVDWRILKWIVQKYVVGWVVVD